MLKKLLIPIWLVLFSACSLTQSARKNYRQSLNPNETFRIHAISTDASYGYSPDNAAEVGGAKDSQGPSNERTYLSSLTGPNGEKLKFFRAGSCCMVKSKNGLMGSAMLDKYQVYWRGATDTLSIYINMYDSSKLYAPLGLKIK